MLFGNLSYKVLKLIVFENRFVENVVFQEIQSIESEQLFFYITIDL